LVVKWFAKLTYSLKTSEWAHSHWVWLCSADANQTSEIQLVDGYLIRDVPVGGVDIDSQWATGDNNFIFDTSKYPDPQGMVDYFHDAGVRVILWVTSVIDTDSSNYQYGLDNNYYLNTSRLGGHVGTIDWWHGTGSFIDYTNPDALQWWHDQMDYVLDIGIDGWKTDGTDPYTFELYPIQAYSGQITERDYAFSYYGDFFNYTRTKNPEVLYFIELHY
jgi:alpha-glucosidase (family GH31 glycosyl hydrolase)